ncbi:MAG: FAD binding domain-containing protein [Caldisericaceae bacterium]
MLKLKEVEECLYPHSIEEAALMLQERDGRARVVGGGLHLTVFPNPSIKTLVFLNNLNLNYVRETQSTIAIGATTTISSLAESQPIITYLNKTVKNVLDSIASELLRNQITIGGSVAQREPYSDITTLLMALNAEITLNDGNKDSQVNINDFYASRFREMLSTSIIKEIQLKKYDNSYKFGMNRYVRNATDIPLMNLAILSKIQNGILEENRIIIGSRPGPSVEFTKGEEYLKSRALNDALADEFGAFTSQNADVEGDVRVSREYRAKIADVFSRNILKAFMEE